MGIGTCLPFFFSAKHQKYRPIFIKKGRKHFIPTKKIFATNKTTALGDHHKWPSMPIHELKIKI
jgi:hypothetical protein